ncbi:hypothetical protein OUO20_13690 [Arthrobacter sp. FX8]|uniref:hypothetical protein n=1 Tax=Arthrobacter sp. FX8 TaxID=2997335 RepID=UPI00227A786B|nr:hypothetical protein [Arthrobacter sp. FX8]WAJ32211.1 hypothetical protein OUO20_13690 [Arthrobacter sp. FX8]
MSDDLEAALRRAVGLETEDDTTTGTTAGEPPALNSDRLLTTLTAALGIINEGN